MNSSETCGRFCVCGSSSQVLVIGVLDFERISLSKHLHPSSQSSAQRAYLEAKANCITHFAVTEAHSLLHVAMRRGILAGTQGGGGGGCICRGWKKDQEVARV